MDQENTLDFGAFDYGEIRRQFVVDILSCSEDGDFLVRTAGNSSEKVVSLFWQGEVRHFQPKFDGNNYSFGVKSFPTLIQLINFHYTKGLPIIGKNRSIPVLLLRPKIRENIKYDIADIKIAAKLGHGNFGDVYKVNLTAHDGREAAMKTMRTSVPKNVRDTFVKEFNMMSVMKHENVVKCLGIVVDAAQPVNVKILLELINKGSLDKLLQKEKLKNRGKSRVLLDVAHGMQYLHDRNVIHRDLAARNILVQGNVDGSITGKVSDFGLSQMDELGAGFSLQCREKLPVKWLAPECLRHKKWTYAADVWSFGILMWEVWTNGSDPYSNIAEITNPLLLQQYIINGGNPGTPKTMPENFVKILSACWVVDLRERASMHWILEELKFIHQALFGNRRKIDKLTGST